MERVRRLIADPAYQRHLARNARHEINRAYCRHDFNHLLDVARITWILCLERGLNIPQHVAYASALLHDIGRFFEYRHPEHDHAEVSASLAEPLLLKYGFPAAEISTIQQAIRSHRLPPGEAENPLGAILAEADDLSRRCFDCLAQAGCYKFHRMATSRGVQY